MKNQTKDTLKRIIREMIEEEMGRTVKYRWTDGFTIDVYPGGKPAEEGWTNLGYVHNWRQPEMQKYESIKSKKQYEISLGRSTHVSYYPEAKVWFTTDTSD